MTQSRTWVVVLVVGVLVGAAVSAGLEGGPETPLERRAEEAPMVRDGRGVVSASTATLMAGGLALLGVALGLFGDRYLRYRGEIQFRSSEWRLTCTVQNLWDPEVRDPIPFTRDLLGSERVIARAEHAAYGCDVKIFNEKEVDTGLRDVAVVFVDDSGAELIRSVPHPVDSRNFAVDPDVMNLPSRQWVYVHYRGVIQPEDFETLARSTRVELRAFLPHDKPFVQVLCRKLWA